MDRIFEFGLDDHARLAMLFDGACESPDVCPDPARHGPYAGYKPDVREAPNSDDKVDHGKRYLHVAPKYNPPAWAMRVLALAHYEACRIANAIGVPREFIPNVENSTLRVIEYPAGEGTAEHTDFDLFTVNLWRSTPEDHEQFQDNDGENPALAVGGEWVTGARPFHMGRIGAMLGLGPAVAHRVPARDYPQQALVYFAMPANAAVFPPGAIDVHGPGPHTNWKGKPVSEWLAKVYAESRVYASK